MEDSRLNELLFRINLLEQEKRRWKRIGIGALAFVLVICLLGGVMAVGAAVLVRERYTQALEAEREAAIQAREAAEQARQAAEEARQGAEPKANQPAR